MDIDELAHAVGVIFCRPPLGDLDLAPGPMDVDADEEIDGAVAAVLVIVTLALAPLRPGRLAGPSPEPGPAPLVAKHPPVRDWPLSHTGRSHLPSGRQIS